MAFLRRGLITNRGDAPNRFNRPASVKTLMVYADQPNQSIPENDESLDSPVISIQKVKDVLKLAVMAGESNLVKLECGHTVLSRSTFQGYCTKCIEHKHVPKVEVNGNRQVRYK